MDEANSSPMTLHAYSGSACGLALRLAIAGTTLSGCWGDLEPCPGVRQGASVRIEILGPTDPEESCPGDWGLTTGTVLEGTIVRLLGDHTCESGFAEFARSGEWEWTRSGFEDHTGGSTLEGLYSITNGSCRGELELGFFQSKLPCDASQGHHCNLGIGVAPAPGYEAKCPTGCSASLNVRAQIGP